MATISMKDLLEAGVHFGHQTRRWNPKMAKYIFGERNGIYIVDLEKTETQLNKAGGFLNNIASHGEYILFVGTKKQAQQAVMEEAVRCGMFYVEQRWLGGTLTNFETIRKSVERLNELEKMRDGGIFDKLTKKEVSLLKKEMTKLLKNLAGIRKMNRLPGALFVIDIKKEETAVKEAQRLNIPIVALVDTNSDPDAVDYVIPGNDDAVKSIRIICSAIAGSILEGREKHSKIDSTGQEQEQEKEKVQEAAKADVISKIIVDEAILPEIEEELGEKVEGTDDEKMKKIIRKKRKVEK